MEFIKRLLESLPEGEKKQSLIKKFEQLQNKSKSNAGKGLHDEFAFTPKGHIKIEEIDSEGNVVGVLADQSNLVVNGAEEILLRAFSGDPGRMLYKNRIPKNGTSKTYYIATDKIIDVIDGRNVVVHHPNELWQVVDDEDFDIDYSYYPQTVYVQETTSIEPNKKAFIITTTQNPNTAPLTAEVYSTYTNLFIGLGDGKNYAVKLDDPRLTFNGSFIGDAERKETSTLNDEVSFTEKISNFVIQYETSNKGGQLEVYIDDILKETIETYNSSLADGVVEVKEAVFEGLDQEKETKVRLKFSGSDTGVVNPRIALTGIRFDAFSKNMNELIHEFENYTTQFRTHMLYNTTPVAPYTIQLEHFPVIGDTLEILYNNMKLERVSKKEDLSEGKFYVDELHGLVYFHRALTNLMVAYDITGQLFEDEKVTNIPTTQVDITVTNEILTGTVDGSNRVFQLKNSNPTSGTLVVKVDGNTIASNQYSLSSGKITFNTAPAANSVVSADYQYKKTVLKYQVPHVISGTVQVLDNAGNQFELKSNTQDLENDGTFMIDLTDANHKTLLITKNNSNHEAITSIEIFYQSSEMPGVPTGYRRQVILKPKEVNEYPWYALDKGSVQFVAEFPEDIPNSNVTIREMGLFDGPRMDDQITGFPGYPVKAFSLVRIGESFKNVSTGIRITWTITLLNEDGEPFQGGF